MDEHTTENQIFLIPGSIIIAGLIIAGAIVYVNSNIPELSQEDLAALAGNEDTEFGNNLSDVAKKINPIDESDHIRGNPDAAVSIVEYSDLECPFCARFHPTMTRILETFPDDVNWVYRHFPLTSIHAEAFGAALASECVAELAGNDAFWRFTDALFEQQSRLGSDLYARVAGELGVPAREFSLCVNSERHRDKVERDLQNALDSGGRGTPYSIIVTKDGDVFPFSGALPYENVQSLVEDALNN